ncbi:MAG: ABC transporter permease, partial [Kutzneria sp.]|nr:ABC transporter permease [Kutzneria sp.]
MTAPMDVPGAAARAVPEAVFTRAIGARSLRQISWLRLKRDRVAMAGGAVILLLVVTAILAGILDRGFGVIPVGTFHQDLIDPDLQIPKAPFGGISPSHLLGIEPTNGRDLLARIFAGSWISLLIAFVATMLSVAIGTLLGVLAGYFGGWVDTLISRLMDVFLAFPLLVFALALAGVVPDRAFGLSGDLLRIALLIFIIGFFNWPYVGRIIRGQTLSLREREFIDAARSLGARQSHILFRELLPNLTAPILVYSTLLIPTNILFEAALSFLGVGVRPPTPTW